MTRASTFWQLVLVFTIVCTPAAWAHDEVSDSVAIASANNAVKTDDAKDGEAAESKTKSSSAKKSKKKSLPTLDKVTEGMEQVPVIGGEKGLMALYRYPENNRTDDQSKLLCRFPKSLLDKDLLVALSVSRGPVAGFQWGDALVRFRLIGKKLVMEAPNARYVTEGNDPINISLQRTYRPTIIASMPLVGMAGSDPIVDLGVLLTDKPGRIPGPGTTPDRSLSHYTKIKVFPDNVLVDVDLAVKNKGSHSLIGISYAFRRLPKNSSFKPRKADERIGYFVTARQDWTQPHTAKETVQRYVHRWQLEKADPSLEMSPPKKPIVFIVEKSTPIRWRHYVQQGILEWNKAFEKLGYHNAIVCQQQTEDNEYADYDPEDARYNFVRWTTLGNPFGLGPRRVDPRSGEILDADIIIDDAFMRAFQYQVETLGLGGVTETGGPDALKFFRDYPAFIPNSVDREHAHALHDHSNCDGHDHDHSHIHAVTPDVPLAHLLQRSHDDPHASFGGPSSCDMAVGCKHQLTVMQLAMNQVSPGKRVPDRLLGELIKHIVTHEVGHALGLRHNFKASAWLTVEEIKRRRDNTDEPTTASVMDYAPLMLFPGDKAEELKHITNPTIGPYDYWAIEYGYTDKGDDKTLSAIGSRAAEPALAYGTDEDAAWISTPDPLTNRWDLASNPAEWARTRVELTGGLMKNVKEWALEADDPAYYLRSTFNSLLRERTRNFVYVAQIITGQYLHRNRFTDPNAKTPFQLIEPKVQREMLAYLGTTVFSDDLYQWDREILNDMSPIRWKDWATRRITRLDYPVHQIILQTQSQPLVSLIAPPVMQRVYDAELKTNAKDKFTAAELTVSLRDMIWSELNKPIRSKLTDARPLVSSTRRNLQNQHLDMVLAWAEPGRRYYASSDLHRMMRFSARELADRIGNVLDQNEGKLDFATRAHLIEAKSRIDRFLEAGYIAR